MKKSFDTKTIIAEQETKVTITIYNVGETTLYSLFVDDSEWSNNWNLDGQVTKFSVEKLEAGESVNFSYSLVPLVPEWESDVVSARVSFSHSPEGVHSEEVLSSSCLERVYRSTYYSRIYYSTPLDWIIFVVLASGVTLPSFLTYSYYVSNYENGIEKSVVAAVAK